MFQRARQEGILLLTFLFLTFLLTACGTVEVNARLMRPAGATATAQAALTPSPTPAPRLGKIAFVRGGDLWVLNLDTGQERRLTQGIWSRRPAWSPSGRWIAFFKAHELWTVPVEDGTPRRVSETAVAQAVWSPVEDRLAYVTASGGLEVVNADGSGQQELIPGPGDPVVAGAGAITWSPDGRWLAFRWREGRHGQPPTYEGLRRIRADGTQAAEIYAALRPPQRYDGIALVSWSPDGSRLAVWLIPSLSASLAADGGPFLTVSAGGGTVQRIAEAVLPHPDFATWSPDGARLALVAGSGRETWQNKRLMVATADGRRTRFLTPPTAAVLAPAWSPDGQRLAYVSATAMPGVAGGEAAFSAMAGRRIWTVRADGSDPRRLTQDSRFRDEAPRWSADGSHILFVRLQGGSSRLNVSLWLMRADGSEQRAVVEGIGPVGNPFGSYGYVDWSELFDWWTGPPQRKGTVRVPPPALAATAPPSAPPTPVVVPSPTPTSSPPTLGPTRPYTDPVLGIAFDVPAGWDVEKVPGAEAHFTVRDEAGISRQVLDLSVLSPESRTLDRALAEVEQGAWGRYLRAAEPACLGAFKALRLSLMPGEGRPTAVWLVIAPSGRGVAFVPGGNVAMVEAVLNTMHLTEAQP